MNNKKKTKAVILLIAAAIAITQYLHITNTGAGKLYGKFIYHYTKSDAMHQEGNQSQAEQELQKAQAIAHQLQWHYPKSAQAQILINFDNEVTATRKEWKSEK